jgi:TRAP-type mannitol/chloroaromatic compound transport system permease large subunit
LWDSFSLESLTDLCFMLVLKFWVCLIWWKLCCTIIYLYSPAYYVVWFWTMLRNLYWESIIIDSFIQFFLIGSLFHSFMKNNKLSFTILHTLLIYCPEILMNKMIIVLKSMVELDYCPLRFFFLPLLHEWLLLRVFGHCLLWWPYLPREKQTNFKPPYSIIFACFYLSSSSTIPKTVL